MEKTTHSRNEQGMLEVFAGNFPSQEAAEEFMALEDGIPRRFLRELYLREEFTGSIKVVYFDKKSNKAEELFAGFPYGDRIIQVLRDKFADKLKRRVNTAIVLYDFNWGYHFTGRPVSVMREKKAQDYHIFYVESVYPYC
ncbi:MAG: hypothetical protein HFF14_08525 [Angelakisella sp.]|jgi:hypothetical protein|nr:hypothetical protein [Angelakisella sp.]